MRISQVHIKNFKRFTDLTIGEIAETTKMVVLVGPNGSGKSSIFDAFNVWRGQRSGLGHKDDRLYFRKDQCLPFEYSQAIDLQFHGQPSIIPDIVKQAIYIRTAYRNQADFTVSNLATQKLPSESNPVAYMINNDETVASNYQRLISSTLAGVFDSNKEELKVKDLRDELLGKIQASMNRVFNDLNLSNIGNPLSNGSFYFEKGTAQDFHYKNLSGGEKSAFDLILDLIIKMEYYRDSIFCIDEPETHMHTKLQALLLEEIYNLVPDNGQIWIATHSLGMLKKAREIENRTPGTVAFIDFHDIDFDKPVVIKPSQIDKTIWNRFITLALDDLAGVIAPKTVVFCEGSKQGRKIKDFDAQCYNSIFQANYPDTTFVSLGCCNDIEKVDNPTFLAIQQLLCGSDIIKLIDRDDKSATEVAECAQKGIRVLKRRHLEAYLLDDEIINKLCDRQNVDAATRALIFAMKQVKITDSIGRNNPSDDIKSAAGEICVELKKILKLTQCGNLYDSFLRDTIVPLITPDTAVYQALEQEVFGTI